MNVKIDTKEKFTVITPQEAVLSANMTEELTHLMRGQAEKEPPHVVINLENVQEIDESIANSISSTHDYFYSHNFSFVVCEMNKDILGVFDKLDTLLTLNYTPTESEAWDMVQMEEIERELLNGEDLA